LLRAGWDDFEVEDFVVVVARAASDEEWAFRKAVARTTRKRLDKDATATGRRRLTEIMGTEVVNRACQWLGIEFNRTWSPRLSRQTVPWPEPIAEEALYGLAGAIVRTIAPETEADPTGLLIQFLVGFGNLIGRNPFFQMGATFYDVVGSVKRHLQCASYGQLVFVLT
jgi:hypothetical protein